ncbi:hypothetical protein A4R29_04990 [Mesorhizobium ciceri biovar biserrulae]|nr:hypothetical protein A4R29_04990 [Mesorhizobium ciceri biovar biserrulae]
MGFLACVQDLIRIRTQGGGKREEMPTDCGKGILACRKLSAVSVDQDSEDAAVLRLAKDEALVGP